MKRVFTYFLAISCFLFFSLGLFAQDVNPKLSIQGTLKDANGAAVENGQYNMTFKLYNTSSGGTAKWTEDQENVPVVGGVYTSLLGSVVELDPSIFNEPLFLGVTVNGTELSPRLELSYAPYSLAVNTAINATNLIGCAGKIGDIKYSILAPDDFETENGDCWVLMDGGSLPSDVPLSLKYGINAVPDTRGYFLRAQDTRTTGRIDTDRTATTAPGTVQGDNNKPHSHSVSGGAHSHNYIKEVTSTRAYNEGGHNMSRVDNTTVTATTGTGSHNHTVSTSGTTESRPKNMNFYLYIRVK